MASGGDGVPVGHDVGREELECALGDVVPDKDLEGAPGDVVPDLAVEGAVPDLRLGEMLLRNAERVARLGSYIGLFEWALFAYWFSVKVAIHLAASVIDPVLHLLPALVHVHEARVRAAGERDVMHVAWCKSTKHGGLELSREHAHDVNHFVLLVRVTEVDGDVPCSEFPDKGDLTLWAENNGFMVVRTVCQGDCGIDCMAAYLGMPRRACSWLHLRRRLLACSRLVCGRPVWLGGFSMAGETEVSLEGVVVQQRNRIRILQSRSRVGKTFAQWITKPCVLMKQVHKTSDGVLGKPSDQGKHDVALVKQEHKTSDGVLVQPVDKSKHEIESDRMATASKCDMSIVQVNKTSEDPDKRADEQETHEKELHDALLWSLGGKSIKGNAPWQVNVWKQEMSVEEREGP